VRAVEYGLAFILLAAVVVVLVALPFRRPGAAEAREDARREEFEAAKEAKYREIRDAELDYRMGKLSEPDWREVDRELRSEAIEILRLLDKLDGPGPLP
jgi:hypothetical protein